MTWGGAEVLSLAREVQIPLLAILLIGGSAAKARHAISAHSADGTVSAATIFPVAARRPIAFGLCAGEIFLGIALLVTVGSFGAGAPATVIRGATVLLFLTAMGTLHELRNHRPEAGCGCFGDLSQTPVSWRSLARSALLLLAALATIGAPPLHMPGTLRGSLLLLALVAAEVAVLAALSPEVGEIMVKLGYSEPCEVRRLPVSRTLASLHASSQWRKYRRDLVATEPNDVWREGCWRYAVFPGIVGGRPVDVVFAVYLQHRRPPIRAAVVDATPEHTRPAVVVIPAPRLAPADALLPKPVFIPAPSSSRAKEHATDLYGPIGTAR